MKKSVKYMIEILFSTLLLGGMTACDESRTPDFNLTQLSAPENLYLCINLNDDQTQYLFTWDMVNEADSYTISVNGNAVVEDIPVYVEEYDLTPYLAAGNEYIISIVSVTQEEEYTNSTPAVLTCTAENLTRDLEFVYHSKTGGYEVSRGDAPFNLEYVVLPDYYDGMEVTCIGDWAFGKAQNVLNGSQPYLQTIRFPKNLLSIGESSFEACTVLNDLNLPQSLREIGKKAFNSCYSLTSEDVVFPAELQRLDEWSFSNCSTVTEIRLSEHTKYIGDYAFYNCENLSVVNTDCTQLQYMGAYIFEKTPWLAAQPNGYICFGDTLYMHKGEFPENTVLTVFPKGVTKLASRALERQNNLVGINIPDGWETVTGTNVFSNCKSLKNVRLPDGFKRIENSMFISCTALEEINLPEGLSFIGSSAFSNCTSLNSIRLPQSVTEIGERAFNECIKLSEINIPSNIYKISAGLFEGCTNFTNFTVSGNITEIGEYAFHDSGLINVIIPKWVTKIGVFAFSAPSIKNIEVSEDNERYRSIDGNLYSKDGKTLFQYAIGKTEETFTVPDEVTNIAEGAFSAATNLKYITLSKNLKIIGASAFMDSGITSFVLPYGLLYIEDAAFSISGLQSIVLPSSIMQVGRNFKPKYLFYTTGPTQFADIEFADYEEFRPVPYFYSESEPPLNSDGTAYNGNYWHYADDGVTPVVWEL